MSSDWKVVSRTIVTCPVENECQRWWIDLYDTCQNFVKDSILQNFAKKSIKIPFEEHYRCAQNTLYSIVNSTNGNSIRNPSTKRDLHFRKIGIRQNGREDRAARSSIVVGAIRAPKMFEIPGFPSRFTLTWSDQPRETSGQKDPDVPPVGQLVLRKCTAIGLVRGSCSRVCGRVRARCAY